MGKLSASRTPDKRARATSNRLSRPDVWLELLVFFKPARGLVIAHHAELDHLHAPARMVQDRRNKPSSKTGILCSGSNISFQT